MRESIYFALAICALYGAGAKVASAQGFTPYEAFDFMYQPSGKGYVPPSSDDSADIGKPFVVDCTVSTTGHMQECYAEPNELRDQGFVERAVADVSRWIVARHLKTGESSAGRMLHISCHYEEGGDTETDEDSNAR